jgi:hypothetical protein
VRKFKPGNLRTTSLWYASRRTRIFFSIFAALRGHIALAAKLLAPAVEDNAFWKTILAGA